VRRICIVIASEHALGVHVRPEVAARGRQSGGFEELDVVDWGEPAWTVGTWPLLAAAR
jgi:hypothetical protein